MAFVMLEIDTILRVPYEVCDTGYVKIVARDPSRQHPAGPMFNWDYIGKEYDPKVKECLPFTSFRISHREAMQWQNELNSAS